jgi:hypothetical protein
MIYQENRANEKWEGHAELIPEDTRPQAGSNFPS